MQKIFDGALWFLFLLFIIPTMLIMASWNSYPGDSMYGVKLALERTLLFFAKPSYAAEASLNVAYTDRRFSEAKVMLANDQTGKGLSYLSAQVTSTTKVIDRAPNQATKKKIATEYVAKLKEVRSTLSEQGQDVAPVAVASRAPTRIPTRRPTMDIQVNEDLPVEDVQPTLRPTIPPVASVEFTQTQQVIEQNIQELEEIINAPDDDDDNGSNNRNGQGNNNNRGNKSNSNGGQNSNNNGSNNGNNND